MKIDQRILKIPVDESVPEGFSKFPWAALRHTPPQNCVFDSYRGTVGFDIFPFAITTRISAAAEVFLKVYEET